VTVKDELVRNGLTFAPCLGNIKKSAR